MNIFYRINYETKFVCIIMKIKLNHSTLIRMEMKKGLFIMQIVANGKKNAINKVFHIDLFTLWFWFCFSDIRACKNI